MISLCAPLLTPHASLQTFLGSRRQVDEWMSSWEKSVFGTRPEDSHRLEMSERS